MTTGATPSSDRPGAGVTTRGLIASAVVLAAVVAFVVLFDSNPSPVSGADGVGGTASEPAEEPTVGDAAGDPAGDAADDTDPAARTGDAPVTRAGDIDDAHLLGGFFRSLPTAPPAYEAVGGVAIIARHSDGTTLTVDLHDLAPSTDLVGRVHTNSCSSGGGLPFQFLPGGPPEPPNEIHLSFTSDGAGEGTTTVEADRVAGVAARSVVVRLADDPSTPVACTDLIITE